MAITRRLLRADRVGTFTIDLRCPASSSAKLCDGSVRVIGGSGTLAKRGFSVRADRKATLRLRLSRRGLTLLRRKGHLRVSVVVRTRSHDGVLRTRTERLTLIA